MTSPESSSSAAPFPPPASTADWERLATERPDDARVLVGLANVYWLEGRGPDMVGELADRARTLDPANRAAWHLWALAEGSPRARVERWRQVTLQFPHDDLAHAALADNAASLAGAEHDPVALGTAIDTYAILLERAQAPEQRDALEQALMTLRAWKL